ncbi:Predicted arabinose efflux permease, MFS family [Actinokineospora terrae]|uniref:Predicted arabinose efflux permease, MFS family n=1 Tax=Actinokineospora terrae TaxID=155974 RepID=A0A1H9S3Y2_9PSEU|nr:Predicted arabinose efflux permease, MFS family [Actinokineospora terrae]
MLVWSLLGRLHLPGTPLATTFLVAGWTGSYIASGVVGGLYTVGVAVGGPLRGRSADQGDPARLLIAISLAYALGLTALAFAPSLVGATWWPIAAVVALVTGLAQPPVTQIARAAWPRLTEDPAARRSLYTLEATLQELLWVVGPVLVAVVVAFGGGKAGMLTCAGLALVGSCGFAFALHQVGLRVPLQQEHRTPGSVLRAHGMRAALTMSLCVVAPLVILDMAVVAWARDFATPAAAGVLIAVWAVGSLVGGFAAGASSAPPRLALRIVLMALGFVALVPVLPPVTGGSTWLIGLVLAVGGIAVAPALAASNVRIGELAPAGRTAEVFGWVMTASTLGSAVTLPVAGWLLDHIGPAAAAGAAAVLALVAAGFAVAVPDPSRQASAA